jgi:hypothetical protein
MVIECPRCGRSGKVRIRSYVDTRADPRAKRDILTGRLNRFRCFECGFENQVLLEVFYHDPEKEFCVQCIPLKVARDNRFLDSLTDDARPALNLGTPEEIMPAYFSNIHLVFDMEELTRYVIFRDWLARRKDGFKKGWLVCFSCRQIIEDGAPCFCISRVRCDRGGSRPQDKIVEATASLQVCLDCRNKAATEDIRWVDPPLPLLNLEKDGFRRFAREDRGTGQGSDPAIPECHACTLCQASIGIGDRYTRIELSEEIHGDTKVKTLAVHALLADVCEKCADQYMVWL